MGNMIFNTNNITVDECLKSIKEMEDGSLVRFYDYVFLDERLKIYGRNVMQESPEIIRLWKQIGLDYNISQDKYFFLYALCLLLSGKNLQYDLCFLYAMDKELREDQEFNELLKNISKLHINEFTDERHITKEEKIRENNGMGVCPFGDAIGSASHLCRKYKNSYN